MNFMKNKSRFLPSNAAYIYIYMTPSYSLSYYESILTILINYPLDFLWQAKEWLHSLGIVDQVAVVRDEDEPDDGALPLHNKEGSVRNRCFIFIFNFLFLLFRLSDSLGKRTWKKTLMPLSSHGASLLCRYIPSTAALPILRPALGNQQSISDKAKVVMQGYLNHFLGNIDILNSREVIIYLSSK